jgi:4-hydroxy-2-oxoheptanedioate aldolase
MASILQDANTLRKALNTGAGLSFGAWQMLPGAYLSRAIAQAGYDWVLIDCEHGNIDGMNGLSTGLPALTEHVVINVHRR